MIGCFLVRLLSLSPDSSSSSSSSSSFLLCRRSALEAFIKGVHMQGEAEALKRRAKEMNPPIPWLVLATYHRGMLGSPDQNWVKDRRSKAKQQAALYVLNDRYETLRKHHGLHAGSKVIDAGCGWGRFGRHILLGANESGACEFAFSLLFLCFIYYWWCSVRRHHVRIALLIHLQLIIPDRICYCVH